MNYSSPFCPDDDVVFTTKGRMQISKLYYKMNPKRDPINRILDIQNIFLSKCISPNVNKNESEKINKKKEKNLKEIKDMNEYYSHISQKTPYINQMEVNQLIDQYQSLLNREEAPFYINDYKTFFQTSINVVDSDNKNNNNQNVTSSMSKYNSEINSKVSSNLLNTNNLISINNEQSTTYLNKAKILPRSHSYVIKLDKNYYKAPTLNHKICILNHKSKKGNDNEKVPMKNNSSGFFDDSDMFQYNKYLPFAKQNYLNGQFDFDVSKKGTYKQLKEYQMKEIQSKKKLKPFVY